MEKEIKIILAEDDDGHAGLVIKNLRKSGIENEILHFKNGEETLDFLFGTGNNPYNGNGPLYVLLLDIRMPGVNGVEVLRRVKEDEALKEVPVIMVTTSDDEDEVERCYALGCYKYFIKPVSYEKFADAVMKLGHYILEVVIPEMTAETI